MQPAQWPVRVSTKQRRFSFSHRSQRNSISTLFFCAFRARLRRFWVEAEQGPVGTGSRGSWCRRGWATLGMVRQASKRKKKKRYDTTRLVYVLAPRRILTPDHRDDEPKKGDSVIR